MAVQENDENQEYQQRIQEELAAAVAAEVNEEVPNEIQQQRILCDVIAGRKTGKDLINLIGSLENYDALYKKEAIDAMLNEENKSVTFVPANGVTALMSVARYFEGFKAAKVLVHLGCPVNIFAKRNEEYRTPLHYAVMSSNENIVILLLHYGADPNFPRNDVWCKCVKGLVSALDYAVIANNPIIARILLESGANPNVGDHVVGYPLHIVVRQNLDNIYAMSEMLLRFGADPNLGTEYANRRYLGTPLAEYLRSAKEPKMEIIKLFLKYGAILEITWEMEKPYGIALILNRFNLVDHADMLNYLAEVSIFDHYQLMKFVRNLDVRRMLLGKVNYSNLKKLRLRFKEIFENCPARQITGNPGSSGTAGGDGAGNGNRGGNRGRNGGRNGAGNGRGNGGGNGGRNGGGNGGNDGGNGAGTVGFYLTKIRRPSRYICVRLYKNYHYAPFRQAYVRNPYEKLADPNYISNHFDCYMDMVQEIHEFVKTGARNPDILTDFATYLELLQYHNLRQVLFTLYAFEKQVKILKTITIRGFVICKWIDRCLHIDEMFKKFLKYEMDEREFPKEKENDLKEALDVLEFSHRNRRRAWNLPEPEVRRPRRYR